MVCGQKKTGYGYMYGCLFVTDGSKHFDACVGIVLQGGVARWQFGDEGVYAAHGAYVYGLYGAGLFGDAEADYFLR